MRAEHETVAVAAPRPHLEKPLTGKSTVGVMPCLVASRDDSHRGSIVSAATAEGWEAWPFIDPTGASRAIETVLFKLAFVDLEVGNDAGMADQYRALVEKLSRTSETLVVTSGHVDQPQEEIWARQLGTWLYLPGIADDQASLGQICHEAMGLARKQSTGPIKRREVDT